MRINHFVPSHCLEGIGFGMMGKTLPPQFISLSGSYLGDGYSFFKHPLLNSRPLCRNFSSCLVVSQRDRMKGVSALRGAGFSKKYELSVNLADLPVPNFESKNRIKAPAVEHHGLWSFFNTDRTVLSTPEQQAAYGRAWTVEELRQKSWSDLHMLWWVCARERNRIATERFSYLRIRPGFGFQELDDRDRVVRSTMRCVKQALTERWYAFHQGFERAKNDPEISFSTGSDLESLSAVYTPSKY